MSVLNYVPRVHLCPTCLTWLHALRAYVLYLLTYLICLYFLRTFTFSLAYILFTCFRFSYLPSYFLRAFIFIRCFKFFAYLTCLHFLCMPNVASFFPLKCQIKEGRRALIEFLFFPILTGVIRIYFELLT